MNVLKEIFVVTFAKGGEADIHSSLELEL